MGVAELMPLPPRLVASDIDGTLLDAADRVTPRLRAVVERAAAAGCEVALATGRPFRWIQPVLDQLPIRPICVTANGAVMYDSALDRIVARHELSPKTLRAVAASARAALRGEGRGGPLFAVERVGVGMSDDPTSVHLTTEDVGDDVLGDRVQVADEEALFTAPAAKLLVICPGMVAREMYRRIAPLVDPATAHLTFSMSSGLIEVAAAGVTKELGVRSLAEYHGVGRERVVAFGDMANDIEMLRWAGLGVAMGNAFPAVKDAADWVTARHDDDGVARVLETWF